MSADLAMENLGMEDAECEQRRFAGRPLSNPSKQIRLLRFLPAQDEDTIRCELTNHDLDDENIRYIAISYTWGSDRDQRRVEINGVGVWVRQSCWYALWQVKRASPNAFYWMDSQCINQADDLEKSAQVKIMASIYSGAQHVAACFGPLEKFSDPSQYVQKYGMYPKETDITTVLSEANLKDYESEMHELLEDIRRLPYFSRLWVVQECMLAKHVEVYWGEQRMPWASLVPYNKGNSKGRYAPKFHHHVEFLEGALEFRDGYSVLWAIATFGKKGCAEPRDKVYGLLSLTPDQFQQRVRVDYSQPLVAFLRDFVRIFRDLDARGNSEVEYHQQRGFFEVMRTVFCLFDSWQYSYDVKPRLLEFLDNYGQNTPRLDSLDGHFQIHISDYFWWPIQQESDASVRHHCAILRRGHAPNLNDSDRDADYGDDNYNISRRRSHILRRIRPLDTADEAATLHTQPVPISTRFHWGDFRVPGHTQVGDILVFIRNTSSDVDREDSLWLILRRSEENETIFNLIGFAKPIELEQNKDPEPQGWKKYQHLRPQPPTLTAFIHPDDVLTLALDRTRYSLLRDTVTALSAASFVQAPGPFPFNPDVLVASDVLDPMSVVRAEVVIKTYTEAAERD